MITHITRATRHFLLWFLILLAVGLSLIRIFLIGVEGYKSDLESKIFELTSIPIEIGKLRANMRGFSPEIILKDIQVLAENEQKKPAIQLQEMRLGVDLVQLVFSRQLLPSSWLTLVGAKLSIIRKQDGSLGIVGLNVGDSDQPLWLLEGRRYEVLKSDITWLDQLNNRPPIQFNQVDLLIKNDIDSQKHELHLLTQLSQQSESSLRVSMSVQGNIFQANNINGKVYVEGKGVLLGKIIRSELFSDIQILDGESDFKLWSRLENSSLSSLSGNVQAKNIVLEKKLTDQTLQISSFKTELNAINQETGWSFDLNDFAMKTENSVCPTANFRFSANKTFTRLAASSTLIELQGLTELLGFFVPLEEESSTLVSNLDLQGQLKNFALFADLKNKQYAVNTVFEKINANAIASFPQVKNLSGSIKGSNDQGFISLNTEQGELYFPKLFRDAFSIKQLKGKLAWRQSLDDWEIKSDSLVLNTRYIDTESKMVITIAKNDEPVLMDLQLSFANLFDLAHIKKYYPVSIMKKRVVDWLEDAFLSGEIEQGDLLFYGDLKQFPFSDNQGVFEVLFNVADVELKYHQDWPSFEKLAAEIRFFKNGVTIDVEHAETNQLQVKQTFIEIAEFRKSEHLWVQGKVQGSIVNALKFIKQTPIQVPVDSILEAITPVGYTHVDLDLKIPLIETAPESSNIIAHLKKAALKVNAIDLKVEDIEGELKFAGKGIFSDNLTASALGFPITVAINSDDEQTVIIAEGKTDILNLKQQFNFLDHEFVTDSRINGETNYTATLNLPVDKKQSTTLDIATDLSGIAINMPESLNKSAEQQIPLSVNLLLNEQALLPIAINYNDQLKVAINSHKQQHTVHSAHIVYGIGEAVMPVNKGIYLQVEQNGLDLSEWVGIAKSGANSETQTESVHNESLFNKIAINTKQLQWKNKKLGPFEFEIQALDQKWQGELVSAMAKGLFTIPFKPTEKEKINFQMDFVNLSELKKIGGQVDDETINELTMSELPLIKIHSEQLEWKGTSLGRLDLETEQLSEEIKFKYIKVISNEHTIKLKANWIKKEQGSVTEIYGSLIASDLGKFLSRLGVSSDLEDIRAKIDYFGEWPGSPYQFSLAKMKADVDVEMKGGRISSIEPGFGRILGLIAMEHWAKRLTLDFDDVFKQGLSLKHIVGHFKINNGKATTRNLEVDAAPAKISLSGEADLLGKTLDHIISVVPKSADAVPIAGTIVSRVAGAITQAITNDYEEGYFFGSQYNITGPWSDIQVTPLHEQDGVFKKTWKGLTDFSWMKAVPE